MWWLWCSLTGRWTGQALLVRMKGSCPPAAAVSCHAPQSLLLPEGLGDHLRIQEAGSQGRLWLPGLLLREPPSPATKTLPLPGMGLMFLPGLPGGRHLRSITAVLG